jgi:hypothetical protein
MQSDRTISTPDDAKWEIILKRVAAAAGTLIDATQDIADLIEERPLLLRDPLLLCVGQIL